MWEALAGPSVKLPVTWVFKCTLLSKKSKNSTTTCYSFLVFSKFYSGVDCKCKVYIFLKLFFFTFACMSVCLCTMCLCGAQWGQKTGWVWGMGVLCRYLKLNVVKQNPYRDNTSLLHLGQKKVWTEDTYSFHQGAYAETRTNDMHCMLAIHANSKRLGTWRWTSEW